MTKEEMNVFTRRITQSSKSELVVITYDIIINYIESASKEYEDGSVEGFIFNLKKAKQFLNDLSSALDFSYKVSCDLMSIYMYIERCIIEGIVKKQPCELTTITDILNKLKVGFTIVSNEDTSGPVMKNGEQVFAGLTYGKGTLNEVSVRSKTYN